MRHLTLSLVASGLPGLRTVSDEGEALYAALEAWAEQFREEGRVPVSVYAAQEALARKGTLSGAARDLGVARSTLRGVLERGKRGERG